MFIADERFWGELTLGDMIFFAVIVGGLVLWALAIVVLGVIEEIRRHGR